MATLKVTNIKNESFAGDQLYLKTDGKIGIGTTSPSSILHTKTSGGEGLRLQGTATNSFIRFTDASNNSTAYLGHDTDFKIANQSNTHIRFYTNDQQRMHIKSDGNIGIGTTNPTNLLEISGGLVRCLGTASARFTVNNGAAEGFFGWNSGTLYLGGASALLNIVASGSNNIQLETNSSTRMTIKSDGDIEVGGNLKTNNLPGRNLIINGSMICSQRGTSFSFAHDGTTTAFTTDRYKFFTTSLDEFDCTVSQDSTVPDGKGFSKSLKLLTGTAEGGVGSGERVEIWQKLEGQDLQHLAYGSSAAKKVTVSFWVRSSITGTFGFSIYRNESSGDRIVNKPYTISSANTWEKKTCTIDGDTVRAITNDTGSRARLVWFLLAGTDFTSGGAQSSYTGYASGSYAGGHAQSGVATTAGATWYITGIQFEIGSIATEFDHKSYGEELVRCQRYYYRNSGNKIVLFNDYNSATDNFWAEMYLPTTMRSAPTTTITSIGAGAVSSTTMSINQLSFQSSSGATHFNNSTIIEALAEL
tara:strand:- start:135 stop:1724 length:1590 start_codon:yes stop_codon:yes gene_type:complete